MLEDVGWLASVDTDVTLLSLIKAYLLGRGTVKTASLVTATTSYIVVARQLDLLGFDNFLGGRIPTVLFEFLLDGQLNAGRRCLLVASSVDTLAVALSKCSGSSSVCRRLHYC